MTGPMGTLRFEIEPGASPELLWVTGFEAVMKDHPFEVASVYDNTSGVDQDAMATMFLYLAAKDLDLTRFRR